MDAYQDGDVACEMAKEARKVLVNCIFHEFGDRSFKHGAEQLDQHNQATDQERQGDDQEDEANDPFFPFDGLKEKFAFKWTETSGQ